MEIMTVGRKVGAMKNTQFRDGIMKMGANVAIGWENINAQGKGWIDKYYKNGKNIIHPIVKRDPPIVKFFNEKTAYLVWTQYNADQEKKYFRTSKETRLMEKDEEGWKIVNVSAFWDSERKIPFDSLGKR
jgi:hypothetical protein